MRSPFPCHKSQGSLGRTAVVCALAVAATCRPPDLTASGGCIPWTGDTQAGGGPPPVAVGSGVDGGGAGAADGGEQDGPDATPPAALSIPVLRVRVALRPGAPTAQADAVGRDDVFYSHLAAALFARPLFENDPDVETLAERYARAAARRRGDLTLSETRSSGLEPFLVATVGLARPAAGAAVTEPTYVVGLTLVVRRAAERTALDAPPAVQWELDLPARAVRSERLVGTVAQAIEARVQVEVDREAAVGKEALADPLLAQRAAAAERQLFELGRILYPDLVAALAGDRPEARIAAARALTRAGEPELVDAYARMLTDTDPLVRLAAIDGFWRFAQGAAATVGEDPLGLPAAEQAWIVPPGDTTCRFGTDADAMQVPLETRRAVLADHIDALREAMKDADPRVARAALVLLAEAGDAEVRTAVRAALRTATDPEAQNLFTVALGRLGDHSAAGRLRQIVTEGGELAPAAAVTLGRLGERGGDEALREMLGSPDDRVRCAAAQALAGTRDADAVGALVPLLSDTQPIQVAHAARAALVANGERALPLLVAALDDPDASVAWAAAEALGEIGSDEAVEPLTAKLAGLDAVLRDYIVDALGRIGDVRSLPALVAALGGTPEYRNEAPILRAILLFGRRAIPLLVDALASPDAGVRAGAVETLQRLGDADHAAAVLPLLTDSDAVVRGRAANYLATAKDDRALAELAERLRDEDETVAAAAAAALGAIGGGTARTALEQALDEDRAVVAAAAARALARIAEPASVRRILDAAFRRSAYDRSRMVEAVVAFGHVAREPLLEALDEDRLRPAALEALDGLGLVVDATALGRYRADERPGVRELVARLLGRTEDPAALESLRLLLADGFPAVREAAVAAAAELGGTEAAGALRTALSREKDEWVARAIRRALLQLGSVP